MAKALCITGMHRSGTSLVASWLHACGIVINDGKSYGAGIGNQFGHFEDADLARLQATEIEKGYKKSKGWIVTDISTPVVLSDYFHKRASELVSRRNDKYSCWSWKDPRSTIFLDTWKQLVPNLKYFFLWRPCCEVVMSLLDRSKRADNKDYRITLNQAVKTWIAYNQCLLTFIKTNQKQCIMTSIHHVLKDDRSVISAIMNHLDIDLNYTPISDLYDKSSLQSRLPTWRLKRRARAEQVANIEQELMKLSYTKSI